MTLLAVGPMASLRDQCDGQDVWKRVRVSSGPAPELLWTAETQSLKVLGSLLL